jgi:hypothetical protein
MCGNNGDPFHNHYRELLLFASMNFERTVFIAGNHEYDKVRNPETVIDRLRNISHDLPNVEFLNRDMTNIYGYTILGASLYEDDCDTKNKMYNQDVIWLRDMITCVSNKKIVLTNRLPRYRYGELLHKFNFYNNPDNVIYDNIYAWLCGHSRGNTSTFINGVYYGINAVGCIKSKFYKPIPELILL